ncbi:MAG: hypothetical protein QNK37_05025 [Acidobacteriota bacterium]|nr:hypothetical protein [Acidobacteriota bacterium]
MDWFQILIALALVMAGRRLYWVFLACVGFAAGFTLATEVFANATDMEIIIVGLVLGLMGLFVALFLQKAAIGVGGFLGGSYITLAMMDLVGVPTAGLNLLIPLLGGLVGIILLVMLFDAALVLLSSIAGAALLVQVTTLNPPYDTLLFLVIAIFGMMFQFRLIGKSPRPVHT